MRWTGQKYVWGRVEVYKGFWLGNLWGKRQIGKPRRIWDHNIKMDLQKVGCEGMDWIRAAQDRDRWRTLVNAAMKVRVP
jgi:hypothetical protein